MKMSKDMLKKADMPPAKGAKDDMLDLEGAGIEDEAVSEGESPEEEKSEQGKSDLSSAKDEDLLEELKKRGYEIDDGAGLPRNDYGDEKPEVGSEGPKPDGSEQY